MPRTEFGGSWWARRWIGALEAIGWESRLARGRSYARSGRVQQMKVATGQVVARVRGSRPTPYRVSITLKRFDDATWEAVFDHLARQAAHAARLLAGEMPTDVEDVFQQANVALFPGSADDLATACSCPDWENPCKHIAAVHYVLGAQLDHDPFLLFELRGRNRERTLQALRERRARGLAAVPAEGSPPAAADQEPADRPLEELLETFWQAGSELDKLHFEIRSPRVADAILKRLGPAVGDADGRPYDPELAALYDRVSRRAIGAAYEGE